MHHEISIPFGAIKSELTSNSEGDMDKFQFLLVRLKEFFAHLRPINPLLFQFLLVRLKAPFRQTQNYCRKKFQFLLVRLKGILVCIQSC